jgi:HEAT repeat protein
MNTPELDAAIAALPHYDVGSPRGVLAPIDDAVRAAMGQEVSRQALEQRLAAVLPEDVSVLAKEYVCGKLDWIGGSASVPALAALLSHPGLAHAARRSLEAMPCPEAAQALRKALPKAKGNDLLGLINALGNRRDAASVSVLVDLLKASETAVAAAAAVALGKIGTVAAGKGLIKFQTQLPEIRQRETADACLDCAERLESAGHREEARRLQALARRKMPVEARRGS